MDAKILVVLSFIASAIAGPITVQDADKCSTKCIESSKFKYNPGTTYVYDYRVDTDSSLAGAFEDSAKMTLQTTANIEILSPCEFALQLRNTRLFHTDGKGAMKKCDREDEFRSEIEGSPLRFSFQNGIVDQLCAEKEDSVRSLNLKKGVLSAFQNSMDDLTKSQNVTETDVAGVCKAEYKTVSNGYYTTEVKKVKNILSCSDRLDYKTMLQLTSYNIPSDMQNLPIMKTTHECDQAIENGGVLKSSVCKESHVYRPFANGESGARVTVTQSLTYQTYRNGVSKSSGNVKSRSSLLFDHSANQPTKEQARISVEQKLGQVCDTTRFDVRPETPSLFSDLVAAMKGLDKQDLADLHNLLKTKTMCPTNGKTYKYFHDALPMVSTDSSVSLMAQLITEKDVTGLEATAWLTSFAFIQTPSSDMLLDVKALIDNKDISLDAMLPVSSMINNFCKKMGTCNQDYAVLSLMSSLERNIDRSCDASGKKFEQTLVSLKAIGNAGHAVRAIPVLNKCMTSTSNPLEIRVAAAEAFRRMPCASEDKDLWETFTDKTLDSELRINAYLALMRCPTEANLGKVAAALSEEDDEQVGAFIYSHLTNLRETSDPHKQGVAEAINNLALDKEFDMSPLKYSRNFEMSALINKINTGMTAESNLIWSNKVQLPRAVSGNLTVELFGQSINILDFGGRLEGLEYLIKNIFGPYVNADEKETKLDAENVKGSIYGRVFGNEMLFMHSQTAQPLFGKKAPSWLDLLIKLADKQQVAFTKSVQFMDVSMIIPSSAGLPINVKVNGTVTVDLNMSGKMDLRKVGSSPKSMDVDGEIRPSAALEITGSMFVDSFVTKTGMRMRNTLHTSSAMKGRVQLTRGQQINIELDTPEDKMEIFDARSQFFILVDDMEKEQEMIKENRKEFKLCSGQQMTEITGMEICGELSFPNASMKADSPYFPMTGPSSVSVTLFKRDSHTGYKLFAKRVENKKASMAQISVNTPGSQVNRLISVDMSLNYKKQNVEMNLATPWKKFAMNGNMMNQKDLKSLSGNFIIDDKDTYAMTGEVKVTQSKTKVQVNPMIELRRPGADNIQVTGFIAMEKPMKSLNMEMSLSGIDKMPYTVKTAVTNNKKERSVVASVSLDGKKEYSVKASNMMSVMGKKSVIAVLKNLFEVETPVRKLMTVSNNADYREDKSLKFDTSVYMYRVLKKPATLKVNLLKTARKKSTNYKAVLNLKSSYVSGSFVSNVAQKPTGSLSLTSKVDYSIPKVSKNTVIFSGKFNDRSTKAYKSYIVQSNIGVKKNPEYNSNTKLEIGHKKKLSFVGLDVKYGANPKDKTKRIYLLTSLNKKVASLKNAIINYKVKAQAPAHNINVFLQGKHQHNQKLFDSNVKLTYAPKQDINAGITLRDRSAKLAKINGKAALSWPGKEYILNTDLTQKSAKQYAHVLNFKSNAGTKHTISTVYKVPKAGSHEVASTFRLHKMKPVSISGSTTLNMKNFAVSGQFKTGKNVYGFSTLSKITKAPNVKFGLELIHPERRVTLDVNGGRSKSKHEGSVEAAWDADNDKTKKVTVGGGFFHKAVKGLVSLGGNVNLQSPFENFENFLGSVKYGSDPSQHSANGKFVWGQKENQIFSTMTVKKPISLNNLQLNGNIKTPFEGIRTAQLDIVHKVDSALSTVIKGDLEKETAKLSIQGLGLVNGFKGNMNLKSSIKNAENVAVAMSHTSKDGSCSNNAEVNHNGKVYAYDLTMYHSGDGWQRKTNGDLVLTLNKRKVATHWDHENTDTSLHSSLSSKWNKNRVLFDLTGSHKLSDLRSINGALKIKSPWQPMNDFELKVDHKHGTGLINSVALLKQGSSKKASSAINYKRGGNNADFDFKLSSPFHEDVSGKLSSNYDSYPMTTNAELQWGPKMKGTLEGSLNLAGESDLTNIDGVLRIKSPWKPMNDFELKVDHKHGTGLINSVALLKQGSSKMASSAINYKRGGNNADFDFKLSSPFHEDVSGKLSSNYDSYPMTTNAELQWGPKMKGTLEGSLNLAGESDLTNIDGVLRIKSPWKLMNDVVLKVDHKHGAGLINSVALLKQGSSKMASSAINYKRGGNNADFDFKLSSPFHEDVSGKLSSNYDSYPMTTNAELQWAPKMKGTLEGSLNLAGESDLTNIDGVLRIKSPWKLMNDVVLKVDHKHGAGLINSVALLKQGSSKMASSAINYKRGGNNADFDFKLSSPFHEDVSGKLSANYGSYPMTTNAELQWAPKMKGTLEGSLNLAGESDLTNIDGVLRIKSPWKPMNDFELKVDHKHGAGLINSVAVLKQGSSKMASSTINYKGGENNADLHFEITSPFHEDLSGKLSTKYDSYPMTTSAELQWAPKMKGTLEGSLNLASWKDADLNLKMTTPSRTFRNVVVKASNKEQGGEVVSHLNLDYGMRQNIDVESRIANEDQKKMFRFRLKSPCDHLKSLNTGFVFNGHAYQFESGADFELVPSVGKFDGAITWQNEDNMSGKIRLDTPFPEYPYFELSTSSMDKGNAGQSHIQAEYYPSQVFSLDSTYTFELPLSFDANIRSPFPEYNDIGMSLQHSMADFSIKSHGEVTYQANKKIEGDFNADWASDVEGSLVVKTPFRGYETNKISMRHRGKLDNFDTHGEIDVAEQNIVADSSFKSGYTTSGTFTFTSPIPGLEHIDATLRKKGNKKNMKGGITINFNGEKIQTTFNNKLSKDSLKSGLNIITPYTQMLKISVDHSGLLESFTNKISINYGRKVDIDTIASFAIRDTDVNGKGILKYNAGNGRNVARVFLTKSGSIEDVSFNANAGFNREDISVSGSLRTKDAVDGALQIKTPFKNFKNTGMTLSHSGDFSDFTTSANINYMDKKSVNGKVEFSNMAGSGIKLSSELTTPFKNFESTSVKVNHDINAFSGDISGTAELTTTIGAFGTGDISYSKTGGLNDLVLKGSVSNNGKDMATMKLTNNMQNTEVHSMCSIKSVATPDVHFSIDHNGDSFSLNTKTMGKIGKNIVSTDANMKQSLDSITADCSITYRFEGQNKNKASISLQKDGSLENCNVELTGKFNNDETKLTFSKSGMMNNMHFTGSASYNKDSIDVNGGWKNIEKKLEGSLKLLTPFDNFKNIGVLMTHNGDLSDFATNLNINYMDGKSINGKVELMAYSMNNVKFVSELMTPFENMQTLNMKFDNNYNRYTAELNGNAAIDTSIAGFGTGSVVYRKAGGLNNLNLDGTVLRNGVEVAELKIKNSLQDQELHSSFDYKSTVTPHVMLTLDHNGDLTNLKSSVRALVGRRNVIGGEATLSQNGNTIDAEGKVMYDIVDYGNDDTSLKVHKEGSLNNFNVELTGKYGGEMSKISGNFKNDDELTGDLTVNTPVDGYKNVGLSFKHSGSLERFNCEGKMTLTDGEEFSGKVDFYRYLFSRIETVIELNTPITDYEFSKFEYRHEGDSDSWKCTSVFQYGNSQRITYDLLATSSPKPQFTVTLKMPQQQVMASGSYENTWPRYALNGKLDAGNGNSINLDGSLDASDDIVGSLILSTPIDGFTNVGVSFQHSPTHNGLNSQGRITYMDGKVISGKVEGKESRSIKQASIELTTPFSGYEYMRYEDKLDFNRRLIKKTTTIIYGDNKRIVVDSYAKFEPTPEFSITIISPYSKDIVAFVSFENSWPKSDLNCKLSPGNGEQFTLEGSFDATKDISGSLKIGTPFDDFNKVGMNFLHSGNDDKFGTEGTLIYMDGKEIFGKINFYRYMWRRIDASLELNTPFNGMENTKAEMNFEDNSNSITTSAALEYNSGEKLNGNVKITYSPNYEIMVTLNTPFREYNVIKAQGALDLSEPTYEAMCFLDYGYNTVYSANTKFNLYSTEHMDVSFEVNTPLSGFEFTKAEYQHKADSNGLDGSVSLTYDNGKKMSCDVKATLSSNFDGTVTVMTPFRGYEKMQGTATFENSYNKYETSSSLNLGQGIVYSMSSELDYSIEPLKASTKINTPFSDFRNVQLDITHEGGLTNFKTTGFFSSPLSDHINAKASLRYDGLIDMSAAASLQSSLEGFDDLRAEVKTSDVTGEAKTHLVAGWTNGQQITFDEIYRKQDGWNEDKMQWDISLSTPFVAVRSMNLQVDHSAKTYSYAEKMSFELNGDSLLDFDAEYNFDDKRSAELIVRQPWPMQYSASKSSSDGVVDAEVFANWNRDEPESNVHVQTTVSDKSNSYQMENGVDFSVTYASRKVGVVHKFSDSSSQLLSNGHVYWNADDDSKVSYDLQVNDNSRRNKQILDGSFKLGLPTRTLGLSGSYSKKATSVSTDAVFSWDADRDETKQVGVKTTINRGDSLKGDISISMPSMRKEIRIDGEVMVNNGRVILDTKTDISYSRDSRKTLTFTSKLEDVSTRNSHFNYSLALGLKHPYTNVDVEMNSHIGSSDESMGVHIDTHYLTSKRQMKNMALWAEINMLKKQISVQSFNPINNIEVLGNVVSESPYKLRLSNKIDNEETFRSEVTIDGERKEFTFNTYTDSDILSFSAKYPNNTAFKVDFTRHTPDFDQEEALLAVRLNTSRLMHTRLSWHPDMMQEFTEYALPKTLMKLKTVAVGFTDVNEAFVEELTSKYTAITNEVYQELNPFITALNEELTLIAEKMDELTANDINEEISLEKLRELTQKYKATYPELISSLRDSLNAMRHFPIGLHYTNLLSQGATWVATESVKSFFYLKSYMAEVDQALKEYKASMEEMKQKTMDTIVNATYVDYLANRLSQVQNINISPYISSIHLPENYTNTIYDIHSKISARVNDMLDRSDAKFVKEGLNEVFQQGVWAYNYWQVEENLEKQIQSILNSLKEIIEDELKEYSEEFKFIRSPITVWNPKQGEIQADIPLPIAIKRLDKLPDFTPLIKKAEKFADTYMPDQGTWDSLVETVSDMWPAHTENKTNDSLDQQLTELKPTKKYKKGRKYKVKRSRQ